MADELEPQVDGSEETPEVEAHASERVLDLQGISVDDAETGVIAASCSSCNGSLCS